MSEKRTPGQVEYEKDVAETPNYPDGRKRKTWDELPDYAKPQWEKHASAIKSALATGKD